MAPGSHKNITQDSMFVDQILRAFRWWYRLKPKGRKGKPIPQIRIHSTQNESLPFQCNQLVIKWLVALPEEWCCIGDLGLVSLGDKLDRGRSKQLQQRLPSGALGWDDPSSEGFLVLPLCFLEQESLMSPHPHHWPDIRWWLLPRPVGTTLGKAAFFSWGRAILEEMLIWELSANSPCSWRNECLSLEWEI